MPYDISIALLCIGFALIALLWKENYGDGQKPGRLEPGFAGSYPIPVGHPLGRLGTGTSIESKPSKGSNSNRFRDWKSLA